MLTLLEFLASVKAVEYLIAIGFVAAFIIYWQILNGRSQSEGSGQRQEAESRTDKAA